MTSRQLLWTCLTVSLFLHWGLLQVHGKQDVASTESPIVVPVNFAVPSSAPAEGMGLLQDTTPDNDQQEHEDLIRRLRRQALKLFLTQIQAAVEHRRVLQRGNGPDDLIGNVSYRFRIRPDDMFDNIRLEQSSGSPRLDQDARAAIASASGTVKRPDILKGGTWTISLTVKYQYAL